MIYIDSLPIDDNDIDDNDFPGTCQLLYDDVKEEEAKGLLQRGDGIDTPIGNGKFADEQ